MRKTVNFTNLFKKDYRRAEKRGLNLDLLHDIIDMLAESQQLPEKNRDHALHGNFEGFRECHIQPDWLLIYLSDDETITLTLYRTGTHSDLLN